MKAPEDIMGSDDTADDGSAGKPNKDHAEKRDDAEPLVIVPREIYPVGMFGPQPDKDDPQYYRTATAGDGKTVTVGPFELTAEQIRHWADSKTADDLNGMVSHNELRAATALTVKSRQFGTILSLLESGQRPSEEMIERFLPGDLQRAVATDLKNPFGPR